MIVDNFEQIKSLLSFDSSDSFYFLVILKRKKDNPECPKLSNSKTIKSYYISNLDYLDSKREEIIQLCELNNARAYINLNQKSYEKVGLNLLKVIADRILNKQFNDIYKAYNTVCGGSAVNIGDKRWIIDIDTKNLEQLKLCVDEICKCKSSQSSRKNFEFDNIIDIIPTVNGWHIITHPFNLKQMEPFMCLYPFDVQKNNPSLLYFNKQYEENKLI